MTEVHRGSDLDEIVDGMIAHMETQIENPALLRSGFRLDDILRMEISFHQLNLTGGSSYLPLQKWIARKGGIINPQNEDDECFKWASIAYLHHEKIDFHSERISNLKKFEGNYDWTGVGFPTSINGFSEFERKNDVCVNLLGVEERQIYILRMGKYDPEKEEVILLLIADEERRHYVAVKNLNRLLRSKSISQKCKQYFCMNCLQGFSFEESRDKHLQYCIDNEVVRVEMPRANSFIKLKDVAPSRQFFATTQKRLALDC